MQYVFANFSPFSLTIFLMKQSNEKGGGGFSCLSVLHRESFHNKPRQRSHSKIFVHSLCAFEPQPKWSVSQQQIAGPAGNGRSRNYPEMYRDTLQLWRDLRRMRREALRST